MKIWIVVLSILLYQMLKRVIAPEPEDPQPKIIPAVETRPTHLSELNPHHALGRPFVIGALYNEPEDRLYLGLSLWDVNKISDKVFEKDLPNVHASIMTSDSLHAKMNEFHLTAEIVMNIEKIKLHITGSAKYFVHRATSHYEAAASFAYQRRTHVRELTMEALRNVTYPNVFDLKTGATHAVTAIEYGANAIFRMSRKERNFNDTLYAHGKLALSLELSIGKISATAELNLSSADIHYAESISCEYMGDVVLPKPPITYENALQAYLTMNELINKTTAVPMRVYLTPLKLIDNKASQLVRQISEYLLNQVVERINRYNTLEDSVADLKDCSAYGSLALFRDHVDNFDTAVQVHRSQFQRKLLHVLPRIRGDASTERELLDALDESNDLVSMDQLARWIRWKLTESGALAEITSVIPDALVNKPGEFQKVLYNGAIRYVLSFTFFLYEVKSNYTECIKNACTKDKRQSIHSPFCNQHNCPGITSKHYISWTQDGNIADTLCTAFSRFKRVWHNNKNYSAVPAGWRTAAIIRDHARDEAKPQKRFAIELFKRGRHLYDDVKLPAISDANITWKNLTGFTLTWTVIPSNVPIALEKYLVEYHYPGSKHWTNLTIYGNTTCFIDTPCDVEIRLGIYCTFGLCADKMTEFDGVFVADPICAEKANETGEEKKQAAEEKQRKQEEMFNKTRVIVFGGLTGHIEDTQTFKEFVIIYYPKNKTTVIAKFKDLIDHGRNAHTITAVGSGRLLIAGGEQMGTTSNARHIIYKRKDVEDPWANISDKIYQLKAERQEHKEKNTIHSTVSPYEKAQRKTTWMKQEKMAQTFSDSTITSSMLIDIKAKKIYNGTFVKAMHTPRQFATSATLGARAYICGGVKNRKTEALASCEVFSDGLWYDIAAMPTPAVEFALVSTDHDTLFAIGGRKDLGKPPIKPFASTIMYSARYRNWTNMANLKMARYDHAATYLDGWVYACGGRGPDFDTCLSSCEKLNATDPKAKWMSIHDLSVARAGYSLLALANGKLYAFYGVVNSMRKERNVKVIYHKFIDIYDPKSNQWTLDSEMDYMNRWNPAVAVLDQYE